MSPCRVDVDRLLGLASQVALTAVALDDAAPAASLLAVHGYPSHARELAAALARGVEFLSAWQSSLAERAEVLERNERLFATSTLVPAQLLRDLEIDATMATHSTSPARLRHGGVDSGDLENAVGIIEGFVAKAVPPEGVVAYFSGIDPTLAAKLAATLPATVGGLGGVPHHLRFMANRSLISRARTAVLAALRSDPDNPRTLRARLAVLNGLDDGTRNFLSFDWERGRIVEWIGPEDAAHVAIFVPGAGVGAAEYPELAAKLDRLVRLEPGGDLAIIAALAYDTPPTVAHAALGGYADRAGPEIIELLSGLELADRHVTLVGHSYGAVVLGEALRLGLTAELPSALDVVVLGAPGVRADHVSTLGIPGERFWAALLPGDEIANAFHPAVLPKLAACTVTGLMSVLESCAADDRLVHGINPVAPAFGGSVVEPDPAAGYGSTHSDYLAVRSGGGSLQPSPMVRELLRILVGRHPGGDG